MPKSISLGVYNVEFSFEAGKATYMQPIRVEEFQKPTFFVSSKFLRQGEKVLLEIKPEYYFGSLLEDWNLDLNWQLAGAQPCWECIWRNTGKYYFNFTFDAPEAT